MHPTQIIAIVLLVAFWLFLVSFWRRIAHASPVARKNGLVLGGAGLTLVVALAVWALTGGVPEKPGSPGTMVLMMAVLLPAGICAFIFTAIVLGSCFPKAGPHSDHA